MAALFGGDQLPLMLAVATLSAAFLLGLLLVPRRFGVRMFRTWGQGGVAGCLFEGRQLRFQLSDALLIIIDNCHDHRPDLGWQGLDVFGGHRRFWQ